MLREAAVLEAKRYFEVFAKLNIKYVTIHANWPPGMFSAKEGIKFQVQTLKKLVNEAKKYGISILYEPMDTPNDNIENISEILKQVLELYLHIDIGHSNLYGRKPEQFIKKFRKKLKHIHLHDNNGISDYIFRLEQAT